MEKFIPFEKLSKKEKKKICAMRRRTWDGLDPVTRVADCDAKAYKRHPKHRKDNSDLYSY